MPTTDCATIPTEPQGGVPPAENLQPPLDESSKPLKSLLFGFAATVTVGLVLASWYLGVRIVAADEVSPSSTAVAPASPSPAAPTEPAPSYAPPVKVELYLQVGSLGAKRDASFVKSLRRRGFRARVQTQDAGKIRVLIGPFASEAEMEQTQTKLQSAGILATEALANDF